MLVIWRPLPFLYNHHITSQRSAITHCRDMLRLPCSSKTRTEDIACEMLCECALGCVSERAHVCMSLSLCPVESDWFWSVGSWQSIRLSQEARDHRAETDEQPSLSSSSPSPSLSFCPYSHLCPLPFPTAIPLFNLTPFPSLLFQSHLSDGFIDM